MTGTVSYDTYRKFMTKEYGTGLFSKHGKGNDKDKIAAVATALKEITGENIAISDPGKQNSAIIRATSKIFINGKSLRASLKSMKESELNVNSVALEIAGELEKVFMQKKNLEEQAETGLSFWNGNEVKPVSKNSEENLDIRSEEKVNAFKGWENQNQLYANMRIPEILDSQIALRYENEFSLKKYIEFNAGIFEADSDDRNKKTDEFLDDLAEWKLNNTIKIGKEAKALPGFKEKEKEKECNNIIWHYSKHREMDTNIMNMLDTLQNSGKGELLKLFNKKYKGKEEELLNIEDDDYKRGKEILSENKSWKKSKPVYTEHSNQKQNIDIITNSSYNSSRMYGEYTTIPMNPILQKEKDYLQNRIKKLADISVWEEAKNNGIFNVQDWKKKSAEKEAKELKELENLQEDLDKDQNTIGANRTPRGCQTVWRELRQLNNIAKEKINTYKKFAQENNKALDEMASQDEERRRQSEERQKISNQHDQKKNNNDGNNNIKDEDNIINENNIILNNDNNINKNPRKKGLDLRTKNSIFRHQENIVEADFEEDEKGKLNQKPQEDQKNQELEELKEEKREENKENKKEKNEQADVKSENPVKNKNEEIIDNSNFPHPYRGLNLENP